MPRSCGESVPGIRKIWLARKANAVTFLYANDDFSIVDWILNSASNPTPFFEFECDHEFDECEEVLERNSNGRSFPQSLTMRFAQMAKEKRAICESLIYDRFVCVFQDRNGRYWIVGQENGLRCEDYRGTSDKTGGGNGLTFRIAGRERVLRREVNSANFIYTSPNGGQGQQNITPRVTGLGGSLTNGGITTILNTWQGPFAGNPAMPLSQLGNVPLIQLMQ